MKRHPEIGVTHRATDRFTELWPALLVLALILWPLDVALRRMSLGRRELAAARGWVRDIGRRRRATARRTATGESLLAARDRAGSTEARAAILGATGPGPASSVAPASPTLSDTRPVPPVAASPEAAAATLGPTAANRLPPPATTGAPGVKEDTIERLRDAKRRARER